MTTAAASRREAGAQRTGRGPYFPIHLATLRVDTVPDFNLYTRVGDRYVLYRSGEHPFTDRQRLRLVDHKVAWLYVPVADAKRYWAYVEAHIPAILNDAALPIEGKARLFHRFSRETVRDVLLEPGAKEGLIKAGGVVRNAAGLLLAGKEPLHAFMRMVRQDSDLFAHSVNVCTYGIALARELGIQRDSELAELGLGFLLHDAGLVKVPRRVLAKRGPLEYGEWDMVRAHPTTGVEILQGSRGIPGESLRIIQTHHERMDGTGYPRGLSGEDIPLGGRVAAIADVFDEMTTHRPHRVASTTFEALRGMSTGLKRGFDGRLLGAFIRLLSS
ncbi:MAG: HD domain-containing protein [Planctomycetes bacterium]|nr:HD domain-containing protein [Planctomycetota bacterium]